MRDADARLGAVGNAEGRLTAAVANARAVHVSTWPLSREPARTFARRALRHANAQGRLTSLDPNYSPRVWPDRTEALAVLKEILPHIDIIKPSEDDTARLFAGDVPSSPSAAIARFHDLGPRIVLYTMGSEGMMLSVAGDETFIPAREIDVVDATGAGDAFWAGFLVATLDDLEPLHAAYVARENVGFGQADAMDDEARIVKLAKWDEQRLW
jgi:fructokinase